MCNLYTIGLQLYWNKLHPRPFLENFKKLSQTIIFCKIAICVEELNHTNDYIKVKITKMACKFAVKSD